MTESAKQPEPWLRGTLTDLAAAPRAVVHAIELAREDIYRWCDSLSDAELNARPCGLAPVAFHIRHMVRSADRLLTYAEGHQLSDAQLSSLKTELDLGASRSALFIEFQTGLERTTARICAIDAGRLEEHRKVGRKGLPTSVAGLLVHIADHTQRHVGQAITTAKIVIAARTAR